MIGITFENIPQWFKQVARVKNKKETEALMKYAIQIFNPFFVPMSYNH
jgi:hypothetical protein